MNKYSISLLLALALLLCGAATAKTNHAENFTVSDGVEGFAISAWGPDSFLLNGEPTTFSYIILPNTGTEYDTALPSEINDDSMFDYSENAWRWTERNRGYGDLAIGKVAGEDHLRYCYDGLVDTEASTDEATLYLEGSGDNGYSMLPERLYDGELEGQVTRIVMPEADPYRVYVWFNNASPLTLRILWTTEEEDSDNGVWEIANLALDIRDAIDEEIAAKYGIEPIEIPEEDTDETEESEPSEDAMEENEPSDNADAVEESVSSDDTDAVVTGDRAASPVMSNGTPPSHIRHAENFTVAEDMQGLSVSAWGPQDFDLDGTKTTFRSLLLQNTGMTYDAAYPTEITDASMIEYAENAWRYTTQTLGYGDLAIAKVAGEDRLRYCFDGIVDSEASSDGHTAYVEGSGDSGYVRYYDATYEGSVAGQVAHIVSPKNDPYCVYVQFLGSAESPARTLRVTWTADAADPDNGTWQVEPFNADTAAAEICARFGLYESCEYTVGTKFGTLNARSAPDGDVIGKLEAGAILTVYRHEEKAENDKSYTLVRVSSKSDRSDTLYYGWVSSEYLVLKNKTWTPAA